MIQNHRMRKILVQRLDALTLNSDNPIAVAIGEEARQFQIACYSFTHVNTDWRLVLGYRNLLISGYDSDKQNSHGVSATDIFIDDLEIIRTKNIVEISEGIVQLVDWGVWDKIGFYITEFIYQNRDESVKKK